MSELLYETQLYKSCYFVAKMPAMSQGSHIPSTKLTEVL